VKRQILVYTIGHSTRSADAFVALLKAHGVAAEEITSETKTTPHRLTPFARVDGTAIRYPGLAPG
jgi:hypothetical protein